jgi:OPA family hexose phosphate transport protein UhpT-like MFS transporter
MTAIQLANMTLPYSIAYGLGKTLLAFLVDERNSKKIMSFLVVLGGIANIGIGAFYFTNMSLNALIIGTALIWGVNGLVLSPGGPCAYSTIMRWLPKSKQATWIGRWNVSHNLGGAFAAITAAAIAEKFFQNQIGAYFIIPGLLAVLVGIWGIFFGNDDPAELGWDSPATVWGESEEVAELIEEKEEEEKGEISKKEIFFNYVLKNRWVILLCLANIFVYIIRMGITSWVIYYAALALQHTLSGSASLLIPFEMSALVGSLFLGWLTDRVKGRRMLVSGIMMILTLGGIFLYSRADTLGELTIAMIVCGFLIFGPQLLIGVSVVKFVPKKAVAVANGLTGTFAYIFGDVLAKQLIPRVANQYTRTGWNKMFVILAVSAVIGSIIMFIVAAEEERRIRADKISKRK